MVIPLALPGIIATSIFTYILAWNDYIFTRILISADELKTLPVGVQDLFHSALIDWGLIMAAAVLITIPALAFFVVVYRVLKNTLVVEAVQKGPDARRRRACRQAGGSEE